MAKHDGRLQYLAVAEFSPMASLIPQTYGTDTHVDTVATSRWLVTDPEFEHTSSLHWTRTQRLKMSGRWTRTQSLKMPAR